jgi:hypothetical protein
LAFFAWRGPTDFLTDALRFAEGLRFAALFLAAGFFFFVVEADL